MLQLEYKSKTLYLVSLVVERPWSIWKPRNWIILAGLWSETGRLSASIAGAGFTSLPFGSKACYNAEKLSVDSRGPFLGNETAGDQSGKPKKTPEVLIDIFNPSGFIFRQEQKVYKIIQEVSCAFSFPCPCILSVCSEKPAHTDSRLNMHALRYDHQFQQLTNILGPFWLKISWIAMSSKLRDPWRIEGIVE